MPLLPGRPPHRLLILLLIPANNTIQTSTDAYARRTLMRRPTATSSTASVRTLPFLSSPSRVGNESIGTSTAAYQASEQWHDQEQARRPIVLTLTVRACE